MWGRPTVTIVYVLQMQFQAKIRQYRHVQGTCVAECSAEEKEDRCRGTRRQLHRPPQPSTCWALALQTHTE